MFKLNISLSEEQRVDQESRSVYGPVEASLFAVGPHPSAFREIPACFHVNSLREALELSPSKSKDSH